jgi:hypothetical protein
VDVWNFLSTYVQDFERHWTIAFRQKRGLNDTSKPGGFSKDLAYFEGLVDTWHWLKKNDFDPTLLYWGKMALEDVDLARKMNPQFEPQLPLFVTKRFPEYQLAMKDIGDINQFEQI